MKILSLIATNIFLPICLVAAPPAHADSFRDKQWHLGALEVAKANAISKGQGVTVAVVDTGVDVHPDLRRNLLRGTTLLTRKQDYGQVDHNGHGTQMASLIAAHGQGSSGVVGLAPAAKILPVTVADQEGKGGGLDISEAIDWSTTHGADVINISLATAPSNALESAVTTTISDDVLIVAGTGNKRQNVVAAYPAAMPGVLAVGASDRAAKHADLSVQSSNVQICAPGIGIESADKDSGYWNGDGTSQATAIASGAAALVRAKFPDLSAPEVIHRLTATATDVGPPGRDDECGYGVLNIVKALTADVPPLEGGTNSGIPTAPTGASSVPRKYPTDAAPEGDDGKVNVAALVGGGVGVVLLAGLVVVLAVRRRRRA